MIRGCMNTFYECADNKKPSGVTEGFFWMYVKRLLNLAKITAIEAFTAHDREVAIALERADGL